MKKFDFYQHRIKSAIREGVVDHEKGEKGKREMVKQVLEEKDKYHKLVEIISLLSELMPKSVFVQIQKSLDDEDFSKLPFSPDEYEFIEKIDKGAVSQIHLLKAKEEGAINYVLKVNYMNKGDIDSLQQLAQKEHKEFEQIRENYQDLPDLIPDEMSFITTATKNNQPAIATLQQYLGIELRDVFTEIKKEELIFLLEENQELRKEFKVFVETTLELANNKGTILDFLGCKNLSILKSNNALHLRFIDPHNICFLNTEENEDRIKKLKKSLTYLEEVKNSLL